MHSFRRRSRLACPYSQPPPPSKDRYRNSRFLRLPVHARSYGHAQSTQRGHISLAMSRSYGTRFRPGVTNSSWPRCHVAKICLNAAAPRVCTFLHSWMASDGTAARTCARRKQVRHRHTWKRWRRFNRGQLPSTVAIPACALHWWHGLCDESRRVCVQPMSTCCKLLARPLCCSCLEAACLHRSMSSTFYLYETRCDRERSNPQPCSAPHSRACPHTAPHRLPRTIC